MTAQGGFWSYCHADDDADLGRVCELARDISEQYTMLTGDRIDLFLDRDSLHWGNAWLERVDESLASVAFFVPVLTPRYFQSAECRRELRTFATEAERAGLSELLLPLLYVRVPELLEDDPADELAALVKRFHWVDWTDLRFEDRASSAYRRNVSNLASRLAEANSRVPMVPSPSTVSRPFGGNHDDDAPGLMDRMAEAESALPEWTLTVQRISKLIDDLGSLVTDAAEQTRAADARGQGFAGRLTVARRLAHDLGDLSDETLALGNTFAQQLASVDSGIRAIIESVSVAEVSDADEGAEVARFVTTVRGLSASYEDGVGQVEKLVEQMAPVENMSRDLRAPLRRMRHGLSALIEGREITREWLTLLDNVELPSGLSE